MKLKELKEKYNNVPVRLYQMQLQPEMPGCSFGLICVGETSLDSIPELEVPEQHVLFDPKELVLNIVL